jgi:alpha,alpha-trehalase
MQNMNRKKFGRFDLKEFVLAHFDFLGAKISIQREDHFRLKKHIEKLWDELTEQL